MMKKRALIGVVSAILLAAMLAGCRVVEQQNFVPSETGIQDTAEASNGTEAVTDPIIETAEPVDPNVVAVNTPYGMLQYQEQWVEFMVVEQNMDGDNLIVSFLADVNGVHYTLFDLIIGTTDGNAIGQLTDAAGVQRNVYVRMAEIPVSDALTSSEQNRVYAMQEEINYVIENLK